MTSSVWLLSLNNVSLQPEIIFLILKPNTPGYLFIMVMNVVLVGGIESEN